MAEAGRVVVRGPATGAAMPFAMGNQTVDPGCHIREHVHPDHDEVIYVLDGAGEALIEGARHPMVKDGCFFLGRGRPHAFFNTGNAPLRLLWLIQPGGLEVFFGRIGRARAPGEPQPEPFPRPVDVLAIEAATVFGTLSSR
jgi:quercetin dioxygenase-like cupin family protein